MARFDPYRIGAEREDAILWYNKSILIVKDLVNQWTNKGQVIAKHFCKLFFLKLLWQSPRFPWLF